jgi:7-carboxy-7-deazaguanine synthase
MPRNYKIKEAFLTLQGEGAQTGRPAVFCRFTGCNLWSGKENDRVDSVCTFCDTDFVGTDGQNGGRFSSADDLADHLWSLWSEHVESGGEPMIVFTGGEPALQLDDKLVASCRARGFRLSVETNGTLELPDNLDWVCVSPKSNAPLKVTRGDELKLVFPQQDCLPESVSHLMFEHYFLQPMDGANARENLKATIAYCLKHPQWRLSVQTHKLIGID